MKRAKLIAMMSIICCQSTVFAEHHTAHSIQPGMMNSFEDGTPMGWENGGRRNSPNKPKVAQDQSGNQYLEITSLGGKPGEQSLSNARMTVSNSAYTIVDGEYDFNDPSGHGSKWAGDYSNIVRIEGRAKATSETEEKLYLRLGLGDYRDNAKVYYSSIDAIEIPTDGAWTKFSFELKAEDFIDQGLYGEFNKELTFEKMIKDVPHVRFVSNKDNTFYGGDRIKATLGLDDIKAIGVTVDCVAEYKPDGSLHIPCVSVPNESGEKIMYEADLKTDFTSPMSFELLKAEPK